MKFHYTKRKNKLCTLRLSEDMRTLYWEYEDQYFSSKVMRRYCSIKDIENVLYGPQSYTFRAYKLEDLVNMFDRQHDAHELEELNNHSP